MRFSTISSIPVLLFTGSALAMPSTGQIQRRDDIVVPIGGPDEPTAGSTVSGGSAFSFSFTVTNFCQNGYTPLNIYLVPGPDAPTAASLNSSEQFSPDSYLAFYGTWLDSNFGLPTMEPGPPPSTFTMPVLDPSYIGSTVYIAVVETAIDGCPPNGRIEWGLGSTGIVYTN